MAALVSLMDLLNGQPEKLAAFVQTHIAATDESRSALVAILPSHPRWFQDPEPGDAAGHVLVTAGRDHESRTHLPAANSYRAIRITALDPVLAIEIDTAEGTVRTNAQELLLFLRIDMTEQERQAIFQALTGKYTPPAPRKRVKPFKTPLLGKVRPDRYGDSWEAGPVAVPFFDGRRLPVEVTDASEADAAAIDEALGNFLRLTAQDKSAAAAAVLANCQDFLALIDLDNDDGREMAALTEPDAIWRYVDCRSLGITKNDGVGEPFIYIVLRCECDWEQEHGLQLVYRNGNQLCRVSEQDGHLLD